MDESTLRLVQTVGIVASLLLGVGSTVLAAWTIRNATRAASIKSLLDITAGHRDIWRHYADSPELKRALDWEADPTSISDAERQFLRELLMHISASFEASRLGVLPKVEAMGPDVGQLISRPIPRAVWRELRPYQNKRFRRFVDEQVGEAADRHSGNRFGLRH